MYSTTLSTRTPIRSETYNNINMWRRPRPDDLLITPVLSSPALDAQVGSPARGGVSETCIALGGAGTVEEGWRGGEGFG